MGYIKVRRRNSYPQVSAVPEDNSNNQDPTPKRSSSPGPLAVWGGLIALFILCKIIELENKELATNLFKYGLVLWVVGIVLSLIIGRSVRETKDNALGCGYIIAVAVGLVIVGVILGAVLPSSCTGGSSDWPYYRK